MTRTRHCTYSIVGYARSYPPHHRAEWHPCGSGKQQPAQPLLPQNGPVESPGSSPGTMFGVAYGQLFAPSYAHPGYSDASLSSSVANPNDQTPATRPFGARAMENSRQMWQSHAQTQNQPFTSTIDQEPYYGRGLRPDGDLRAAPLYEACPSQCLNLSSSPTSCSHQELYPSLPTYQEGQDYHHLQHHQEQTLWPFDSVYSIDPPLRSPEPPDSMLPLNTERTFDNWPHSPVSEPAWSESFAKGNIPPHERGDTPQSDVTGRSRGSRYYEFDGNEDEIDPASPALSQRRRMRAPKYHKCSLCDKAFPRPSGLATHMNTHTGARPFTCIVPGCDRRFAVRSNARRHLRAHGLSPYHDSGPRIPHFVVGFDEPMVSHNVQSLEHPDEYKWVPENQGLGPVPDLDRGPTRLPRAHANDDAGSSRSPGRRRRQRWAATAAAATPIVG